MITFKDSGDGLVLQTAIRAFTTDMPGDKPNGERDRQLGLLIQALEFGNIRAARAACDAMCGAGANDLKALRVAAEAFFGGDFRAPVESAEPGAVQS